MRIIVFLFGFLPFALHACPINLQGAWKSDKTATMEFSRENTKLKPETEAFLSALLGHMTMTFSEAELQLLMPNVEVPVHGEKKPFSGFEEKKPYKVIFCSDNELVFTSAKPFGPGKQASTLHFVDPNTFWVYAGTTAPDVPDVHVREFFRRVQ